MFRITCTLLLFSSIFMMIVYSVPVQEDHSLKDVCKMVAMMDKEGKIEMRKKVLQDCAVKHMPPEKIEEAKKCKEKFDFENKELVIKACQKPEEYEAKYQELKQCFKSNKPDEKIQADFQECVKKGFSGQ